MADESQQLGQLFDQLAAFERPAVDQWYPQKTVDFDLRIAANGDWIHEGDVIQRHKLAKLFSTVLAFRDGAHYLVTPGIKYRITVDEAPFQAVELTTRGEGREQQLFFRTNMDEVVMVDATHPLRFHQHPETAQPVPCVVVRDGLTAKLTRSVYYQMVDMSLDANMETASVDSAGATVVGIYSDGEFFTLG